MFARHQQQKGFFVSFAKATFIDEQAFQARPYLNGCCLFKLYCYGVIVAVITVLYVACDSVKVDVVVNVPKSCWHRRFAEQQIATVAVAMRMLHANDEAPSNRTKMKTQKPQ